MDLHRPTGDPVEEYIVAGEPYTLVEAFDLAESITGIDAPRAVPAWPFRGMAAVSGVLDRFLTAVTARKPTALSRGRKRVSLM
ncbi:hypothetical protein BRD00_11665 [Halobacteriales archaeon QS_8_69_26]|nr:MAG: hypothetical protein BRD00_11665 [Halobacteriales archaeon QS_8_69_26]